MSERPIEREEIVVEWAGAADVSRARELFEQARACVAASHDVVVQCDALERIDASALQILLALQRAIETSGGRFRLAGLPPPITASLSRAGAHALSATELPMLPGAVVDALVEAGIDAGSEVAP